MLDLIEKLLAYKSQLREFKRNMVNARNKTNFPPTGIYDVVVKDISAQKNRVEDIICFIDKYPPSYLEGVLSDITNFKE